MSDSTLNFALSSLFAALLLFLSYCSLGRWVMRRQIFYLALFVFLLALAGIGSLVLVGSSTDWRISALATSIIFLICITFGKRIFLSLPSKVLGIFFALLTLALTWVLPSYFFWQQDKSKDTTYTALDERLTTEVNYVNERLTEVQVIANEISVKPEIINAARTSSPDLGSQLQAIQQDKKLGFIIVTDGKGVVLARSHQDSKGDNLFERLPWTERLKQENSFKGIALDEHNVPIIMAAAAIEDNNSLQTAFIVGYFFDSTFFRSRAATLSNGLGLVSPKGIVTSYAKSYDQQRLLDSADLNTYAALHQDSMPATASFSADNKKYRAVWQELPTLFSIPRLHLLILSDAS